MKPEARAICNPAAAPAGEPYGSERSRILNQPAFDAASTEISSWPDYAPTPLVRLDGLARALDLREVWYKDERGRFGLKSFKALGGAYAVANVLRQRVLHATGIAAVTSRQLVAREFASIVSSATVTCATDGNHGRSVAWGAHLFGCRCVIFVHEHVSQGRRDAIAHYGAEVHVVNGNYDAAVRQAAASAAANGWTVVSDTSYPGYRAIPLDVMHGYGVMAAEITRQLPAGPPPTHVFVQAGVGALAAAICAHFWLSWRERRPACFAVEPTRADCVYQSLAAGHPVVVGGSLDTVMAGLACGEVSELAWEILHGGATGAIAVGDAYALEAVRRLASPSSPDAPIVAGETGGSGLAALLAARDYPAISETLALDRNARVLLLGSEGDTDPAIYRDVVGRTAEEVLA
jgi:diaminopropionate ammonia-lyase